jgi:hypothetical protein
VGTYEYDFVASNALGVVTSATVPIVIVPIVMEDLGTNTPTPGPYDIAQLLYTPGFYTPGGLNYYTDDGAGHSAWAGQTFITGTNKDGYVMTSLTWKSSGNGSAFTDFQFYDFYVFSVAGTPPAATQIASYQCYGGGPELDWYKFVGLNVSLAPNTLYAYAFGRDSSATGWEDIASVNTNVGPYTNGQVCTIYPPTGGPVTYGTGGTFDATFDIGLTPSTAPFAGTPTYTPNVNPIYAATTVTLNEVASGTPPLTLQWYADNGTGGVTWTPVPAATLTNLVVDTTSLAPNSYEYEVVVKNNSATVTSAPVTLTLVAASAPIIVTDTTPSPINENYAGEDTTFSATFAGTLPIYYQWMVNTGSGYKAVPSSSNPSATNDTLILTNVQAAEVGTYYLFASNSIGSLTNTPATLTVLAAPAPPAAGTYGAALVADGPLAYWQLNDTGDTTTGILPAYDFSGHNLDGVYGAGAAVGAPGPTSSTGFPGFPAGNTAVTTTQTGTADAYVHFPDLNIPTNTATITAWIYPTATQPTYTGLVMSRNYNNSDAAGLAFGGTINAISMPALCYYWNKGSAATYGFDTGLFPPLNQWSFVALTIQPSNATVYLYYIDPVTKLPALYSATNPVTNTVETFSVNTVSGIGTNAIGTDPYSAAGRSFTGNMDQVAVFDTTLTDSQILAMFGNAAGISSFAPSITAQPLSKGAYAGATVNFTAAGINGTAPFSYQWQFNGVNLTNSAEISGATNLTLTLSDVAAASEGTYTLLVKNSVTTTVSSNATLVVKTPAPGSYEAAVLQMNPLAYWGLDETNAAPGTAVAYDYVNGLNGVYQSGAEYGYNGIVGPEAPQFPGFPATNWALETFYNTASSYVSGMTVGTMVASNLTYAMWINPQANAENWSGLLMDRGAAGEGFGFGGTVNAGGMTGLGYTWNQNSSDSWDFVSDLYPETNQWSFVAMVIEPTKATIYLMSTNQGIHAAVNAISQDTEEFGVAWHIGDDAASTTGGRTFPGMISGVGVFLSALSSNQLVTLYDAGLGKAPPAQGVTLDIAKATAGNLTVAWSAGTLVEATNLAGPWITNATAVSPYTVTPTNSQLFFKVK